MALLVALDVGLQNLALCALRMPPPVSDVQPKKSKKKPPLLLDVARGRLYEAQLVMWEVVPLGVSSHDAFPERAAAVARFIKERHGLFQDADFVIIEHQRITEMIWVASKPEVSCRFQ